MIKLSEESISEVEISPNSNFIPNSYSVNTNNKFLKEIVPAALVNIWIMEKQSNLIVITIKMIEDKISIIPLRQNHIQRKLQLSKIPWQLRISGSYSRNFEFSRLFHFRKKPSPNTKVSDQAAIANVRFEVSYPEYPAEITDENGCSKWTLNINKQHSKGSRCCSWL